MQKQHLKAVVYVSLIKMPVTAQALEGLLVEARDLNLENNITGVLLCSETNFMQCFEGEQVEMDDTYDRIKKARAHTDIVELLNEPIIERAFADWQMGFARATSSELLTMSTANWKGTVRKRNAMRPSPGLALLKDFWKNAR